MGTKKLAGTEFRETLHRLRRNRGWSQAHLAELLSAKGLGVYPTTIAKIEAGDRAIQIDELVAVADIFEVSVDALLGHSTKGAKDKAFLVEMLDNEAGRTVFTVDAAEYALRDAVASLDTFKLNRNEQALRDRCAAACDALRDVLKTIALIDE